jgi:hypothetical protein
LRSNHESASENMTAKRLGIGADMEFSGKMYHDLDAFVRKFTHNRIAVMPEAAKFSAKNPIIGEVATFPENFGYLVAEYIRRSDLLRQSTELYRQSPNRQNRKLVADVQTALHRRAMELNASIQIARARNWFDEGLQAKLDEATKEKQVLENRIDELTTQLKECQENYVRYQEFVKKPKGGDRDDTQLGDVLSG